MPQLMSIAVIQRKWRIIPAKAKHKRDCEFKHCQPLHEDSATRRLSRSWRSTTMVIRFDTLVRWWAFSSLEQRTMDWRTQSFCRQTQNGVSCGPKRNDSVQSCIARAQSRGRNQSKPNLLETDTFELEGTHMPHGQLFQVQIHHSERSVGRRLDWEAQDKLVSSQLWIHTSRHRNSVRSTGKDSMMNQE